MKFEINKWSITRGQDEQIPIFLVDELGEPISISGASEVHACFQNQDNSVLEKNAFSGWSIGITQPLWVYGFAISKEESLLLKLGVSSVEVKVLFGTTFTRLIPILKTFSVTNPPF